ncbi:ATP-binding cassette domain-containing protein [Variovorax sp. UC122_21]|uniref:ATP-binding cassette domain-containing protein n=1 Tax=Variovorax sp. UC122_21 TaxID=3374554 RepID=UPI0037572304
MTLEQVTIAPPLLDVRGLDVFFHGSNGPIQAVRGLDLTLQRGETLALVGESGCGKSTTALALLRLLAPGTALRGSIHFDGRDILRAVAGRAARGARARDRDDLPGADDLAEPGAHHRRADQETLRRHEKLSAAAARRRAIELLDLVRIPEPQRRIDDHPHNLSGGQRQRVMIAMAVACKPRLLVADEPTTALDVTIQAQILELLDGLRRELDMALLLITHDLGLVAQWADRVAVMYGGEKVEEAPTSKLFAAPSHAYTRGLLGASLHAGSALHYADARLPEIQTRLDPATGVRDFALHVPQPNTKVRALPVRAAAGEPLLSVQDLRTDYPTRGGGVLHAVDGVSFDIRAGETVGLVGESGCGKSTLSRTLLRLVDPAGGRIVFDGTDIASLSEKALKPWRRRVQMVFQDPYASLNPRRSVFDILESVLKVHGVDDRAERRNRIAAILERVGLPADAARRFPNEFSGGQRQAHRHRASARAAAVAGGARRAGVGARRVGAGADPEPAGGAEGGLRAVLPVHLARSVGGAVHRGSGDGDEQGEDRGDGGVSGYLGSAAACVYAELDCCCAWG